MPESETTAIRRQKSEIQCLREQIEAEIASMRQGFSGLAAGVAKHHFIEARMHRIGQYEDQLAQHLGKEEASQLTCQVSMQQMEEV